MSADKKKSRPGARGSVEALAVAKSNGRQAFWLATALFILVFSVFYPLTGGGFINYDDDVYVTANYHMQAGLDAKQLGWAFSNTDSANWHPLTWLSHMLDCQLYGMKPWGHHLTNVVLHALNAALLFGVMRAMTGAMWRSLAVALLFGLHPLRVESVAWIAERKDELSGTFWLLTMWAYVRYAQEFKVQGPKTKVYYGLALLCFVFGLMSKPMVVTLPFILLLMDWWPLKRIYNLRILNDAIVANQRQKKGAVTLARAVAEKSPFFLLAAAGCVVTFLAQKGQGAVMGNFPVGYRMETVITAYARYLGKFFCPVNLAVLYPHPATGWPVGEVLASAILLAVISWGLLAARHSYPYELIGWLWFLGALVPVIGLVQVGSQSMADRYTYLPGIGLNIAVVWGAAELAARFRVGSMALAAGAALAGAVCFGLTEHQIGFWKDSGALFSHAVMVTQNNYQARKALGDFYWSQGNGDEAVKLYRQAIDIYPGFEEAHLNLGAAYSHTGRASEAAEEFKLAIALRPKDANAYNNLGTVLGVERMDESIALFRRAVELDPAYGDAWRNLGQALDQKHLRDEAMVAYRRAAELGPDATSHYFLGMDLARAGRKDEAINEITAALRLQPDYPNARQALELLRK